MIEDKKEKNRQVFPDWNEDIYTANDMLRFEASIIKKIHDLVDDMVERQPLNQEQEYMKQLYS